jgi:hypothetical protein
MSGRAPVVVVVACLLALVGHIMAGHVHADAISAEPLAHHEPGDEHHDASASCDAVRAAPPSSTEVVAVNPILAALAPSVVPVPRPADLEPPALPAVPLFQLHAALLI